MLSTKLGSMDSKKMYQRLKTSEVPRPGSVTWIKKLNTMLQFPYL